MLPIVSPLTDNPRGIIIYNPKGDLFLTFDVYSTGIIYDDCDMFTLQAER